VPNKTIERREKRDKLRERKNIKKFEHCATVNNKK
jgi:hypothetical protein